MVCCKSVSGVQRRPEEAGAARHGFAVACYIASSKRYVTLAHPHAYTQESLSLASLLSAFFFFCSAAEVLSVSAAETKELKHGFQIVTARKNYLFGTKSRDHRTQWIRYTLDVANAVPLPNVVCELVNWVMYAYHRIFATIYINAKRFDSALRHVFSHLRCLTWPHMISHDQFVVELLSKMSMMPRSHDSIMWALGVSRHSSNSYHVCMCVRVVQVPSNYVEAVFWIIPFPRFLRSADAAKRPLKFTQPSWYIHLQDYGHSCRLVLQFWTTNPVSKRGCGCTC